MLAAGEVALTYRGSNASPLSDRALQCNEFSKSVSCMLRAIDSSGRSMRIVKGAYSTAITLAESSGPGAAAVDELEKQGFRVLTVAAGDPSKGLKLIGLIAFSDPPRTDAAGLIKELEAQGGCRH